VRQLYHELNQACELAIQSIFMHKSELNTFKTAHIIHLRRFPLFSDSRYRFTNTSYLTNTCMPT